LGGGCEDALAGRGVGFQPKLFEEVAPRADQAVEGGSRNPGAGRDLIDCGGAAVEQPAGAVEDPLTIGCCHATLLDDTSCLVKALYSGGSGRALAAYRCGRGCGRRPLRLRLRRAAAPAGAAADGSGCGSAARARRPGAAAAAAALARPAAARLRV